MKRYRPRQMPVNDEPAAAPPPAEPTLVDDITPGCDVHNHADEDTMQSPIRALLAERGLTIATLAQRAGVCQRTIYRWIKDGTTPQRANRRAIARVLGVDEFEVRRLGIQQRRYVDFGRLHRNLLSASCVNLHAARLSDDELRDSRVSIEQLDLIIEQFQELRQRVASLSRPSRRKRNVTRSPANPPAAAASDSELPTAGPGLT